MEQAFHVLQSFPDFGRRMKYPAVLEFQFHSIVSLGGTCFVERGVLKDCFHFPFILIINIR
eukprot:3347801-Ditylum_brightwellii.AAC.1